MTVGGVKQDSDKPRVDLVPVQSVLAAARAFTFGAKKYSPWNWMKGLEWLRLYGAVLRHLFEWTVGVTKDKESGLHPLDHALASLMMLQTHVELGLGKDDRAHVVIGPPKLEAARVPNEPEKMFQWFLIDSETTFKYARGPKFATRAIAEAAFEGLLANKVDGMCKSCREAYHLREVPK
jgi:hypothetical protein